jgi:hypothetical protein
MAFISKIAAHIILCINAIFIGNIFADAVSFMVFKSKPVFFSVNGNMIDPWYDDVTQMPRCGSGITLFFRSNYDLLQWIVIRILPEIY